MPKLAKLFSICILAIVACLALIFVYSKNFNQADKTEIISSAKAADPFVPAIANVYGFAWSGNIGWLSFNNRNCDNLPAPDGDGLSDTALAGCPVVGTFMQGYGVNVDLGGTNNLSGYAWSGNVGWVSFNWSAIKDSLPFTECPSGDGAINCQARLIGTNLTGWARACSVFQTGCSGALKPDYDRGGWDGWINLRKNPFAEPTYGVSINGADFEGFAWGADNIGWLSFNSKNCDADGDGLSNGAPPAGCPVAGGSMSAYKVYLLNPLNTPPTVSDLITNEDSINYCIESFLGINLSWTFTDPDLADADQTSYDVKITRSDGAVYDSGIVNSINPLISGSYIQAELPGFLRYNTGGTETYSWEVTVYDSFGASDGPVQGPDFSFPLHQYPDVGFAPPPPLSFFVGTPIDFTITGSAEDSDNTKCYPSGDNTSCNQWEWDFDYNGVFLSDKTINGINGNWTHTYTLPSSSYKVVIQVTDNDDYVCSNSNSPEVLGAVKPKWKEVVPR